MADNDPSPTPTSDPASDPATAAATASPWRWLRWVAVGVAGLVVLVFGAVFVYANFINDPEEVLTVADLEARLETETTPSTEPATTETTAATTTTAAPADPGDIDGRWEIGEGTEVGYRVGEILFGVETEGVGRTDQVTGALVIEGTTVTEANFSVDLASMKSDDTRRDGQFRGRIMAVADYPTAEFVLTEPIELGRIPAIDEQITATATGELTLRGTTLPVTFELTAQRTAERIGILGDITVVFSDYGIPNPSIAGITTEPFGLLEFVIITVR